ncbi:MAG: hypothetical protein U0936_27780 [Planctomycetaceae bacterium]
MSPSEQDTFETGARQCRNDEKTALLGSQWQGGKAFEIYRQMVLMDQFEQHMGFSNPKMPRANEVLRFQGISSVAGYALHPMNRKCRNGRSSLKKLPYVNQTVLRAIKVTLQMDILRCKTPELVRKEIWTHILAYNLICTIMAQAVDAYKIPPCPSVSKEPSKHWRQDGNPPIDYHDRRGSDHRDVLYQQLLEAIVAHRVADRPDRFEPRARKRNPTRATMLMKPRHEAKRELLKRRGDN